MAEFYRYAAFISYSSKEAPFAKRLHRALEAYAVPKSLGDFDVVGGGKKNRIYPVFRDREELAAGQLGEVIEANLRASASLIVVCSPNAVSSLWVQKEIEYFRALPQGARVFAVVPDSVPSQDQAGRDRTNDYFPSALGDEPLAADARAGRDGFHYALLKLIAGIVGVSPGLLRDRDKIRRRKRAVQRIAAAFAVAIVVSFGVAGIAEVSRRSDLAARGRALMALPPIGAVLQTQPQGASAAAAETILRETASFSSPAVRSELSAVHFAENDEFAVLGMVDGSLAKVVARDRTAEHIEWRRACEDRGDTLWPDCAIFSLDVRGGWVAAGDALGNVAVFDDGGRTIASRLLHNGAVAGLLILRSERRLLSVGLQGDAVLTTWPALDAERRVQVGCRVIGARYVESASGQALIECADGRTLSLSIGTGVVSVAAAPAPPTLGAVQFSTTSSLSGSPLSSRSIEPSLAYGNSPPPSTVRHVLARSGDAVVVITEDGAMVGYRGHWIPAPFIDRHQWSEQTISLSGTGRFLVLNVPESEFVDHSEVAVVDLSDFAELNRLVASSRHLRRDICLSRWAPRLRNGNYDPCVGRGLLVIDGWRQLPESFRSLWER